MWTGWQNMVLGKKWAKAFVGCTREQEDDVKMLGFDVVTMILPKSSGRFDGVFQR